MADEGGSFAKLPAQMQSVRSAPTIGHLNSYAGAPKAAALLKGDAFN